MSLYTTGKQTKRVIHQFICNGVLEDTVAIVAIIVTTQLFGNNLLSPITNTHTNIKLFHSSIFE